MHEIIIEISQAKPKITVKGFKGKGCIKITEDLEKALGQTRIGRKLTHEYNQSSASASNRAVH
jgi:hypothetical protein